MSTTTTTTTTTIPTTTAVTSSPALTTTLRNEPITASNVTTLFPEVTHRLIGADLPPNHTSSTSSSSTSTSTSPTDLSGYDAEQIRLMDEMCIVLTTSDEIIGSATKKYTHLMTNISRGLLHRAFSVFLFDRHTKRLLLQQRAAEKITFPDMWTNTCCSHPLAHPAETGQSGDLVSSVEGAKRAAVRKLGHELGIEARHVPVENFRFLTRIHYLAPSGSDGTWGEHEIDYILFVEVDTGSTLSQTETQTRENGRTEQGKKFEYEANPNEVSDTRWVSAEDLRQMFRDTETKTGKDKDAKYTPWFRLICEELLFTWWAALERGEIDRWVGEQEIRRM